MLMGTASQSTDTDVLNGYYIILPAFSGTAYHVLIYSITLSFELTLIPNSSDPDHHDQQVLTFLIGKKFNKALCVLISLRDFSDIYIV